MRDSNLLRQAAARALGAGATLRDLADGREPNPFFALESAESALRKAFLVARRLLIEQRRNARQAA